jgi:hypothetical protein
MPLEACLADLSDEEAELLKLAALVREVPHPARDPDIAAAQRAEIQRQVDQQFGRKPEPIQAGKQDVLAALLNWLRPRRAYVAAAGALAALFACAVLAMLVAVWALRGPSAEIEVADVTPEERVVENVSPEPPTSEPITQIPSALPTQAQPTAPPPVAEATAEPAHTAYLPVVSGQTPPSPERAALQEVLGLVEVQASDGSWATAVAGSSISAGQGVRTGDLSSARLAFYDGSQARLGPRTEITIGELDARQSDGPRVVALTQWMGTTDHEVATADTQGSRYEIQTPSSTGEARGTAFRVEVMQDDLERFNVDRGVVAVTSQDVTVNVVAGQSTTINAGEPPDEPAFRITGEGKVTQTGTTWIIAGQSFQTHAGTITVGDPQVGDWVFVEGRLLGEDIRIADRIVLLRGSPANRFAITGRVEAVGEAEWVIAGQAVVVDGNTLIDDEIQKGSLVRAEGIILEDGVLRAEQIRLLEKTPGLPFGFTGVVQGISSDTWIISGIIITIDEGTDIDTDLKVGDIVNVRGWIVADGMWLARVIERAADPKRTFEFTGIVDSVDPWVVDGIPFQTREWTEIEPGIQAGDLVKVEGRILEDGTWVASEIKLLGDTAALRVAFVGEVQSINPWMVSGIPLEVNADTAIQGDIAVGDLVKVTVTILPDGTWLANRIELIDDDDGSLGCVYITAVVVGVGPGWIEVPDRPRIDLNGVIIEGQLQVGSVILMLVCVDEDGSVEIVRIVVIYEPKPVVPPKPPAPPPETDKDHKVTVCHKPNGKNPHSITISRSALQAHLNHGDTLGPCK